VAAPPLAIPPLGAILLHVTIPSIERRKEAAMRNVLTMVAAGLALGALSACAPKVAPGAKPEGKPTVEAAKPWGCVGGKTVLRPDAEVKNTKDKAIYLNERYSLSACRVPLRNGTYTVRLHFAETYEGITEVGQRVFSVSIEGKPALPDFDVYKEAGKQRLAAVVKEFEAEVKDGELTIEFQQKVQNPMINGIEVIGRGAAKGFELRINCGAAEDYKDSAGRVWKKDQELPTP
jgi:hypothetical protein